MDAELRVLLHALPTKADIESLIGRLEEQHHKDLKEVKWDMQSISTWLTTVESSLATHEKQVAALEFLQDTHLNAGVTLQLHMEDMDRGWRNNLWVRGLPEVMGPEDLAETAVRKISDDTLPANIKLDQIPRALGPRPTDPNRTLDVICRVHHYTHKESIIRKVWEAGDVDFNGATVKILPNLSRATLHR